MFKEIEALKAIVITSAKDELISRFTTVSSQKKADGSLVTEADLAMQNRLQQELHSKWPDIGMLSEEMSVTEQEGMLSADKPVWCLDPLDGTSNYAAGIPYFAVSLSLIHHGHVVLGLVYDPVREECFSADDNGPALLNGKKMQLNSSGRKLKDAIAMIDFKRLTEGLAVRLIKEKPVSSQRNFGAAALDWCWLAANRGHVYLHGKQNIWDYSAGLFILKKAGGSACTLDGEDIFVNKLIGRSVVAAENQALLTAWKNWINESS